MLGRGEKRRRQQKRRRDFIDKRVDAVGIRFRIVVLAELGNQPFAFAKPAESAPTATPQTAEHYAQNAKIVACVSSVHKREVLACSPVKYPVVIE